ncbi:MAG TPA: cytochrome c1 [Rhizobiales bacterium]|nr:cytochrome c1 [Hyphomicrobiales bacterium]
MKKLFKSLAVIGLFGALMSPQAIAEEDGPLYATDYDFSFEGIFGTFDRAQLQRGFLVYKEVCASCHSLKRVKYRNLGEPGGPEFSKAQVKALAAEAEVTDGPNNEGEMFQRPGQPFDFFVSPFPNDEAAKAGNNGALPPDLSLITKSRSGWHGTLKSLFTYSLINGTGGPEYVASLLSGYGKEAPEGEEKEGLNYNPYFVGKWIAMPPPLSEDGVEYADGTKATVEQQAKDVAAFLTWAAEPKMEERKSLGLFVLLYMAVFTALLYLVKKAIWSNVEH